MCSWINTYSSLLYFVHSVQGAKKTNFQASRMKFLLKVFAVPIYVEFPKKIKKKKTAAPPIAKHL